MGIARSDLVISFDKTRRIYSKCSDNRDSMTSIECINGVEDDIPFGPLFRKRSRRRHCRYHFRNELFKRLGISSMVETFRQLLQMKTKRGMAIAIDEWLRITSYRRVSYLLRGQQHCPICLAFAYYSFVATVGCVCVSTIETLAFRSGKLGYSKQGRDVYQNGISSCIQPFSYLSHRLE